MAEKCQIIAAKDGLTAGGSTAGAGGIANAYRPAEANFDQRAVNRINPAIGGDFNVGITNRDDLNGFIERTRKTGLHPSILGVGRGNHNDALMRALAQHGHGRAAYVDTLNEARKALMDASYSRADLHVKHPNRWRFDRSGAPNLLRDIDDQFELGPLLVFRQRITGFRTGKATLGGET